MADMDTMTDDKGLDEPYSAQVLRRLFQDFALLMQEYDEMSGPLEQDDIKNHLHDWIAKLGEGLDTHEELMGKHHPDLPPLAEKDMDEEEEPIEEEDKAMDQDDSDSETEEEPSPDDVVEGMQTKLLSPREMKELRKHWKTFKGSYDEEDKRDPKSLKKGIKAVPNGHGIDTTTLRPGDKIQTATYGVMYVVQAGHSPEDEIRVTRNEEDVASGRGQYLYPNQVTRVIKSMKDFKPADTQDDTVNVTEPDSNTQDIPAGLKSLFPHEYDATRNAAKFLKSIGETDDWTPTHQMEAYHHHKALEAVGKPGDDSDLGIEGDDVPGAEADSEEAASGMVPEGVKDYGIEGEDEPGSEADREESRSGHKPEHKKAFDAADQQDEVVELNEPGEKSLHPHRMKCMAASKYLKSMSQVEPYQFHPDHKALAMEHHKAIDPIGDEEDAVNTNEPASNTQDVPPGQMGEKALKKLKQEQIKQRSQMIEVNKKIAALYNALK